MRATYLKTKNTFLIFLVVLAPILHCSCSCNTLLGKSKKGQYGKIIVLTTGFNQSSVISNLSNHINNTAINAGLSKGVIVAPLETIRSEEDYHKELSSMHNRAENLNYYLLQEIEEQGWDKQKNEFVLLGYSEEGLTVLESSEELRKHVNLTKVILVSVPLDGYDFYNSDYGLSAGAIGELIMRMRKSTLGHNSTVVEEITPGSDYLKKRHAFIESQTGEKDLKFYIAGSSLYKLCFGETSASNQERIKQLDKKVSQLFDKVAKKISAKYHKTQTTGNPDDLPGVEEYMRLWRFLEKTDKQGFYTVFKILNKGKDHNGKISLETQLAHHVTNPRIKRQAFDNYSSTLFIPYKELRNIKDLGLFHEKERTLNNVQLYEELAKFILELE